MTFRINRFLTLVLIAVSIFGCTGRRGKSTEGPQPATEKDSVKTEEFFTIREIDDSLFARMQGKSYHEGCPVPREELRYLRVLHRDIHGKEHQGELVCNQKIARDLIDIFRELYIAGYPIENMRLIDDYGGDDDASMMADNSSCFNYRNISHSSLVSKHALGLAVDINPLYNPAIKHGRVLPEGSGRYADRSADFPYKVSKGDLCYRLFLEHGFSWGGNWASSKDYQHFELK